VQEGVQMHGGIGMTDELDIGFYMKRARTAQEWLGDANWQLNRWAGMRGY
jgi:alkylation response protein AidB-like acyl-CoA dehydrogenase